MKYVRKLIWVIIIGLLSVNYSLSQENLINNIPGRETYSLNGKWKYLLDPYDEGKGEWYGFYKDSMPTDPTARVEYGFEYADWLYVPGDWNSQKPELLHYEGILWYRKRIDFQPKKDKRYFLHFDGANYITTAYVNGKKLGSHEGGFTPFNFEVTEFLNDGDNSIVIRVDNTRQPNGVPTLNTDWWNYGGLTRDVNLVELEQNFVQDYFVQLKKGSKNTIKGYVKVNGKNISGQVTLKIPEANVNKTIAVSDNGGSFEFEVKKLELWSPENPKLYKVQLAYGNELVEDNIGFRTIEVKGTDILLNGKPVFLRGISVHEENPIRGGRAFNETDADMLLGWVKDLNCNMVRLAHYPHNQYMLHKADELGLLVWEELPVYWQIHWKDTNTYNTAQNQLHEAIIRDKNRASVIIWSMANETHSNSDRDLFVKNLLDFTRSQDDTRLVSAASFFSDKSTHTDLYIDDPFGEYADLMAVNFYNAWYTTHTVDELKDINFHYKYNKPLFISEFGAGAQFGFHGDSTDRWTEEFQAYYYREKLELLETIPEFRGCSPWILADFRCPRRFLPEIQDYWNKKGIISERGHKKKAFYVLKNYYQRKDKNYR